MRNQKNCSTKKVLLELLKVGIKKYQKVNISVTREHKDMSSAQENWCFKIWSTIGKAIFFLFSLSK